MFTTVVPSFAPWCSSILVVTTVGFFKLGSRLEGAVFLTRVLGLGLKSDWAIVERAAIKRMCGNQSLDSPGLSIAPPQMATGGVTFDNWGVQEPPLGTLLSSQPGLFSPGEQQKLPASQTNTSLAVKGKPLNVKEPTFDIQLPSGAPLIFWSISP